MKLNTLKSNYKRVLVVLDGQTLFSIKTLQGVIIEIPSFILSKNYRTKKEINNVLKKYKLIFEQELYANHEDSKTIFMVYKYNLWKIFFPFKIKSKRPHIALYILSVKFVIISASGE